MKARPGFDDRYRSLLQKAVRRGKTELVFAASALIDERAIHTQAWFEKREAFIVFGDCWPLGAQSVFTRKFHSKVAALVRVARATKYRDATGLGFLAYALAKGDASVLEKGPDDRVVRLIAKAVHQPADYWEWISRQTDEPARAALIASARRHRDGGHYLLDRVRKGWTLVALEWEREADPEEVQSLGLNPEVPYGLKVTADDLALEENPDERQTLTAMLNLIVRDDVSFSQVARELNEMGFRTRAGNKWTQTAVFEMLPRMVEAAPTVFSSQEWEALRQRI